MPLADVSETYTDLVTTVFSSTIAAKAWLATIAVVLALVQVTTAARIFGKLSFLRMGGPWVPRVHRWSGRTAFLFTLPVFFHCVTILSFQTRHAGRGALARRHVLLRRLRREGADRPRSRAARLGAPRGRDHARVGAGPPLADVESLVLHKRAVRVLMGRCGDPFSWAPSPPRSLSPRLRSSSPRRPLSAVGTGGDVYRGETVFQRECSSCHGVGGEGGGIGPRLVDAGLDAVEIAATIRQGSGVMPPALVAGREEGDVVAYVFGIAQP